MKKGTMMRIALGTAATVLGALAIVKLSNTENVELVDDMKDAMDDSKDVVIDLFENVKEDVSDIIE